MPGLTHFQLSDIITPLYHTGCCGVVPNLADEPEPDLARLLAEQMQEIWKEKGMPETVNHNITRAYAKKLWSGVTEGYGKDFAGIDYDTPDYNMLASLQRDVFHFSAAKNYQQLKDMSQALIGEDGKLRTYGQFKHATGGINGKHAVWLKTEYNTAVCSGQMSGKWVEIQKNKGIMNMLEFDAVMDGRTSDICRNLDGVTKEVDSPFWDIWYPPNHFGERGTVRQQRGRAATPDSNITLPAEAPKMFQTNLAKQGLAFPPQHPYHIGLPTKIKKQAEALIIDPKFNYRVQGKHGGYVDVHKAMDKNKKAQHMEAAGILADRGNQVQLLPEVHIKDPVSRKRFFPELKPENGSNPDARFNGVLGDFKIPDSKHVDKTTIQNAIKTTAKKDVGICCISLLDKEYTNHGILSAMRGALKNPADSPGIKEIWIITKDKNVVKLPRKVIVHDKFYKIIETL